ncbi:MAG TPA: hypothetical protein VIF64_20165 [Pyrinomonadaceae bacterium]|jgi:hypothetical protein
MERVLNGIVMVIGAIIETVESILGWVLSAIALIIELVLCVPVIGRLLAWILGIVQMLYLFVLGILDTIMEWCGLRPEKKLRVCTFILSDENGQPVTSPGSVVPLLQRAIDVFKQEANVRVVPVGPFHYTSPFGSNETASEDWIKVLDKPSRKRILDLGGEVASLFSDLIDIGGDYNLIAATRCFYPNWRRVVGYGAPITVLAIRSMGAGIGRSLGPLTDYLVIDVSGGDDMLIAHEMGHACYLWHLSNNGLMHPYSGRGTSLNWWQRSIIRSSRHVTYF